jgi:hypothetical protein
MIVPLAVTGNQILFHPAAHRVRLDGFKRAELILSGTLPSEKTASKIGGETAPSEVREIPAIRFARAGVESIFCLMNKPSNSGQSRLKL